MKTKEYSLILREVNNNNADKPKELRAFMKSCKVLSDFAGKTEQQVRREVVELLCDTIKSTLDEFEKIEFTQI